MEKVNEWSHNFNDSHNTCSALRRRKKNPYVRDATHANIVNRTSLMIDRVTKRRRHAIWLNVLDMLARARHTSG